MVSCLVPLSKSLYHTWSRWLKLTLLVISDFKTIIYIYKPNNLFDCCRTPSYKASSDPVNQAMEQGMSTCSILKPKATHANYLTLNFKNLNTERRVGVVYSVESNAFSVKPLRYGFLYLVMILPGMCSRPWRIIFFAVWPSR